MNLADLFNAATSSANSFEVIKSDGTLSGHRITLKAHTDKDVILASARYNRVLMSMLEKFDADNAELKAECEAAKNFTEYNLKLDFELQELRQAFAAELVSGWDFDNEFTKDELTKVLTSFTGDHALHKQILDAYNAMVAEHAKK